MTPNKFGRFGTGVLCTPVPKALNAKGNRMRLLFDVFGKRMSVHRQDDNWLLFTESDTGIRARVYDVVIPSELEANELAGYLDDIYHEYATEKNDTVNIL